MAAEQRTFQIQLEGLIQLLAQNLYADPDVFLREMIQNAHDSIVRRAELAGERGLPQPPPARIHVEVDRAAQQIRIADNGCGLTDGEIDDFLSTIGRSGTDELRRRVLAADRGRTVELIGQFGIGLLSAFIVADRVTVVTKATGHDALRWESFGGRDYTVTAGVRDYVGTTVVLHIAPAHTRYLDSIRLKQIIRTYADFIGIPVYLNDDAEPANSVDAPWHRAYSGEQERFAAHRDFWDRKFVEETALHLVVVDEAVVFPDVDTPGGEREGRIRGVLAVTDRRTPDVNARGTVDVYVNRMFIGAGNRDVLPPWAKFMQGVVECDELTPNAARDNVRHNAALVAVQRKLGDIVVRELTRLSHVSRRSFTEIMRWHSYHILAMAVQPEHERFFRAVADLALLESDAGPMTVADYVAASNKRPDGSCMVHYITEDESANQYMLLAGARDVRVFNCTEAFAERFLKKYAETWPERIRLTRLDQAGAEALFEPLSAEEAGRYAALERACQELLPDRRVVARTSRFEPAALPAVLTETRDGQRRREMSMLADDLAMPSAIRGIVQDFLSEAEEPLTLHLNAANPIIRKLAARPSLADEVSLGALHSLYNNALMLLARTLPSETVQSMFTRFNQVIDLMLGLAEQVGRGGHSTMTADGDTIEEPAPEGTDALPDLWEPEQAPYLTCAVSLPPHEARAEEIFEAVRAVLEDRPYYWEVRPAGEQGGDAALPENLNVPVARPALQLTVLAGPVDQGLLNELTIAQIMEQPLLVLRDSAHPPLPSSLESVPHQEISGSADTLRDQVAAVLAERPEVRDLKAPERFLSATILSRRTGLSETVSRLISGRYRTVQSYLDADSGQAAELAGIPVLLVDAVKATLSALIDEES